MELIESINSYDYKSIYKDSFIDLNKDIIKPEPLLYIGKDYKNERVPAMTKGEYSVIVGASKARKSYLKSLIVASYIGGNASNFTDLIVSTRSTESVILDIDTEQGKYYAYKTFKRVRHIVGSNYEFYKPFALRKLTPEHRLDFIDEVLKNTKDVSICFIDGLADLLDDVNNLVLSNKVVSKLMEWTDVYGIHICTVLHKNFNSSKPTGHIGSSTLKKSESVIFVNRITNDGGEITDKNFVRISSEYSRGLSFNDIYMGINRLGLPFTIDENDYQMENYKEHEVPF